MKIIFKVVFFTLLLGLASCTDKNKEVDQAANQVEQPEQVPQEDVKTTSEEEEDISEESDEESSDISDEEIVDAPSEEEENQPKSE
jgi:cytoskeletal protein RodZ